MLVGFATGSVYCSYFGSCSFSISPDGTISGSYSVERGGGGFSISFGDISVINAADGEMHAASGYFDGGEADVAWNVSIDRASVTRANGFFPGGGATISPVPEPRTWALMIAGFALVGFSMRRRKVAFSFA